MFQGSKIFEKHYNDYCEQIGKIDFESVKDTLDIEYDNEKLRIPLFNREYFVSKNTITDASGNRPGYATCVILAKYILLCPDKTYLDGQWVSFKDFKRTSHFTNVNFFSSDTEQVILKGFNGRLDALLKACKKQDGVFHEVEMSYDLSMKFDALPRMSLLLLFNDKDEEFPAQCTVLFQKHSELYLDPESLIMTSALLAKSLISLDKKAVL